MKRFALYALVFEVCALALLALLTLFPQLEPAPQDTSMQARVLLVDSASNRLYDDSVRRFAAVGDADVGGFMKAFEVEVHIAAVRYIDGPGRERAAYPYISNFNLQYALGKWLTLGSPALVGPGIVAFEILCATGMALVVGGIATVAHREFGQLAGAGVVAVFALSPAMLTRSFSPYWVIFLHFLPFLATFWLYPRVRAGPGLAWLAVLLALLTFVKSLTGYEYLSNVVLGPLLAVLYYEYRAHPRFDRVLLTGVVGRGIVLGLASVAGFVAAVGLHVWKAAVFFGSWREGMQAFTLPLTYSTTQSASGIRGGVDIGPVLLVRQTIVTFVTRNPLICIPLFGALAVCVGIVLARNGWSPRRLWIQLDARPRALWLCFVASVPVSLSWIVLAQRHSVIHPHINWVLGYMFVNVFGVILLADLLPRLRRPGKAE